MAMAAKRSDEDKSDIARWIMHVAGEDRWLVSAAGKVTRVVRQEQCAAQVQGQEHGRGCLSVCVGKRVHVSMC